MAFIQDYQLNCAAHAIDFKEQFAHTFMHEN